MTVQGAIPSRRVLDQVAARGAAFVADMDRADGAFHFQVRSVDPAGQASTAPRPDELLALLPPGSRWTDALGWSSYFGWPLTAAGRHFWAVGAEEVCPGPDRGAYPALRIYLHTTPPVALLTALAAATNPTALAADPGAAEEASVVVVWLPGTTPIACLAEQATILRRAAAACARGGAPLYRTAVLAEGEVLPLVGLPRRTPRGVDGCFLGVSEALSRTFSTPARAFLYLRGFWST
jgi:hypothetical protein